jgi:hypothetical protein
MSQGKADPQRDLLDDVAWFCEDVLAPNSIYKVLNREGHRLFPDEMFADLYQPKGRRSVPPSIVAVVMVLQRLEGLSDREAVERYAFDARWRFAAGVSGYGSDKWGTFAHTVLVGMRARLAKSDDPRRIFDVTLKVASEAGLVGVKRVLDSTPLYDAVATMDTITLIRSAIRSLLRVASEELESELRGVLTSGDDYASNAKPQIDWDNTEGRAALIDSRARDGYACLLLLENRELDAETREAAELLATVLGQDLEESEDGTYRIARRVAKDRVISTVDPDARHGHKTAARGFDGYKGHIAEDPDSEIITSTDVSAGNAGDASVAPDLVEDLIGSDEANEIDSQAQETTDTDAEQEADQVDAEKPKVYGDAAYGSSGEFLEHLDKNGIDSGCKTQPPCNRGNLFPKSSFVVDLDAKTVTCPAGVIVPIGGSEDKARIVHFAPSCQTCGLRSQCTTSSNGRYIRVGPHEKLLADARHLQEDPEWMADYQATRPKVERKIGHLMRRRHGGRRARVRGRTKVAADFSLLAAAINLARLASLGIRQTSLGWVAEMT